MKVRTFAIASVVAALVVAPSMASAAPSNFDAYWLTPAYVTTPEEASVMVTENFEALFPQEALESVEAAPCGRVVQADHYKLGDWDFGDTLTSVGGGLAEDHDAYLAHEFIYTGDCDVAASQVGELSHTGPQRIALILAAAVALVAAGVSVLVRNRRRGAMSTQGEAS